LVEHNPDTKSYADAHIAVPKPVWERLKGAEVSIGVELAVAQLEDMPPCHSTLTMDDDRVPGLGYCRLETDFPAIRCRTVFGEPPYFTINTVGSGKSPDVCDAEPKNLVRAAGSFGRVMPGMVPFIVAVSPVHMNTVWNIDNTTGNPASRVWLCPGAAVTYVGKRVVRRLQLRMPEATIALKDHVRSR